MKKFENRWSIARIGFIVQVRCVSVVDWLYRHRIKR